MNDIQCNSNPEKEDMLLVCTYIRTHKVHKSIGQY